jgi:hypothetical protein
MTQRSDAGKDLTEARLRSLVVKTVGVIINTPIAPQANSRIRLSGEGSETTQSFQIHSQAA